MLQKKSVSLVLGSGGARGLAHIGVIRYLEENGYEIKSISGCSMGALIGGFYAVGKLDDFADWLKKLSTYEMLKLLDFQGTGGLVSGVTLMQEMKKILGEHQIESLDIKYTAIAADVKAEKEIWINQGSLLDAIRASISLPLFFTPYPLNGRDLIDGGVLNPVPIAPTFHDETELTIAVNLGGNLDLSLTEAVEEEGDAFYDKVIGYFKSLALPANITLQHSMLKIADQSFDAMQGTIARMKLSAYPPDIEIEIPRNLCGTLEFTRVQEMIDYGYEKCKKVLGQETKK